MLLDAYRRFFVRLYHGNPCKPAPALPQLTIWGSLQDVALGTLLPDTFWSLVDIVSFAETAQFGALGGGRLLMTRCSNISRVSMRLFGGGVINQTQLVGMWICDK